MTACSVLLIIWYIYCLFAFFAIDDFLDTFTKHEDEDKS